MARPDWTWKEYPGVYDPPAVPEHYNNPQWSTHDLYYTFGLAKDYDSHNNLIYYYFDHNYPLALWLPDGIVVRANTKKEFADLIRFTRNNQTYLPGWENVPPFPFKKVISFEEFGRYIEDKKAHTNEDYRLWKTRQDNLLTYLNNVREFRRAMGQPVPEIPSNFWELDSLPEDFIITAEELDSKAAKMRAPVFADRLSKQIGKFTKYSPNEIAGHLRNID